MPLQVLINELSEPTCDCTDDVAAARLEALVGAVRALRRIAQDAVINSAEPLPRLSLCANWPLAALRNRPAGHDAGTYLKTVVDNSPFVAALAQRPDDGAGGAEYRLPAAAAAMAGRTAVALGLAHDVDGIAVSLPTHAMWETRSVALERLTLDADANLTVTAVEARNCCSAADVEWHGPALLLAAMPDIADGAEMWADRERLFPNLRFIPRTRGQVEALQHGTPVLASVAARLRDIDRAVGDWRQGGAAQPTYAFPVTPESRRRRHLVVFADDDGAERVFSDHARYTPDEGRIHFLLETEPHRRAAIGHVGRKIGIG